jgi:mRNA interferase MazF
MADAVKGVTMKPVLNLGAWCHLNGAEGGRDLYLPTERGDIRWFRFGSPDKRRPVLVLGKPDVLPSFSQVPVIPLSTQVRALAWEVALTEADGVPTPCVVKPEWIRIVDRACRPPWRPRHHRR